MRATSPHVARAAFGWSVIATAFRFASAILLLPLMLRNMPPEELGLWYIFLSLGMIAALVDLGFAPTAARFTGYLWAGSPALQPFGVELAPPDAVLAARGGGSPNRELLERLVASLRVYYRAAGALVLCLLLSVGGAWVWHNTSGLAGAESIRWAFVVYAMGVAISLANSLWPSLLLGTNAVRQAQRIMAASFLVNFIIAAAGLWLGYRIWALVLGTVGYGFAERFLGRAVFQRIVPLGRGRFDFVLLRTLWPNAWRTAAVSAGLFLTQQANTLICSAFLGLTTTASYGFTLQVVLFLVALSSVWITTELPLINQWRAQGLLERIARLFRRRIVLALLTFVAGGALLLSLGPTLLALVHPQTPLLPAGVLAVLLLIQLLEMHHSLYAWLVVSENVNPFLLPSLLSGVAIVLLSLLLTPRLGLWGMLLATGAVQLCFNNWWPVLRAVRGLGPAGRNYWRFSQA